MKTYRIETERGWTCSTYASSADTARKLAAHDLSWYGPIGFTGIMACELKVALIPVWAWKVIHSA